MGEGRPVTLVLGREPRRRATPTGRRTAPEDLVALLLPGRLHSIHVLEHQIDRVIPIRVPSRLAVVVMTRYADVRVPWGLGRRKDGEEHGDGTPVGEEVALAVVRPRILAERVVLAHVGRERKFVRARAVLARAVDRKRPEGAEEPPRRRAGVAGAAIRFPDIAFAPPVGRVHAA